MLIISVLYVTLNKSEPRLSIYSGLWENLFFYYIFFCWAPRRGREGGGTELLEMVDILGWILKFHAKVAL